jgi:hypothetical protein
MSWKIYNKNFWYERYDNLIKFKGSELDREVLKGKPADVDLSSLTLKDTDF